MSNWLVVLGHGASGNALSMAPYVSELGARGIDAAAIDLRRGKAEDAVGGFWSATEAECGARENRPSDPLRLALGGQSFGGRVASLVAAARPEEVRALVCFSYPLHPPGRPAAWDARTAHWPAIRCPVLLLSGEADPFAKINLLREAIGRLATVELVTYARLGHGLKPVLADVTDRVSAFLRALEV